MARKSAPADAGRTTVKDVAARAGVSPATVSRVLLENYPVAAATRTRVLRAMRELDYVVNAQARALSGSSAKNVAFLADDITGAFYAYIARGVMHQAKDEGRLCIVCNTDGDWDQIVRFIDLMRQQAADAVILVGGARENEAHEQRLIHYAHALARSGSRLVLVGRPPLSDPTAPATVVEYDNEGGAYAVTGHLLAAGHRRIAFLGQVPGLVTSSQRVAGFHKAHRAMGVDPDPGLIVPGDHSRVFGHRATRRLLDSGARFTAVVAATDVVAAGALQALREAGKQVPGDVAVVGYDDIPLAADLFPALTTVHVPQEELGRAAVRLALSRGENAGPQHLMLGTHVVVRDSAPPPGHTPVRPIAP
ncbi:LacI family DNA-binding transcriptional regulator [Actinoplanes derwentensis]|uniref:Transcriptional regulator, LacI family n=1 Tax=Actinoplanes derwentensis TaxID=113562 RepID=A0A1H1XB39_9ACTN|nr:LacI family DNA-binding transcriptional regulator [Actinoplanes derwentensis]GID89611.1 LacI family transcriptional regulator [Actinoplanes derwentensis]SDT05916.1 transcriptional regulator, LacI family [Actinoplanes derwentensis]